MPSLRILKGVIDVKKDAAGRTVYVLPPAKQPRRFTWIKQSHGTPPIGIKQHMSHSPQSVNKAMAHRLMRNERPFENGI